MNRLNIVCLIGALCLLVAPALTLPADAPEAEKDVANDAEKPDVTPPKDDAANEAEKPVANPPKFSGGESGVIKRVGVTGTFHCKQITCPPGTETCKYNSKYSADGKTAEVNYKCIAHNETVLLEETKNEPVSLQPSFDFNDIFTGHFPFVNFPFKFPFFN